ncbi:CHAT domain-containing protein [Nocardioides sp.]|uniref:CHAT domain-containing protein n=1 Tax=Nocardioides sp. TaxID=35761 RepID=UPI002ED13613
MSGQEFQIKVTQGGVEAMFGTTGTELAPAGDAALPLDRLTLDTCDSLARLLHIWDVIEEQDGRPRRSPFGRQTLEVLGSHLWRLLLDNEVGRSLSGVVATAGRPTLRVLLEFDDYADETLRGLPWEFLYDRTHEWFLSAEAELMLTRYVSDPAGRANVAAHRGDQGLRVLLVSALPDTEDFASQQLQLYRLRTALQHVEKLQVLEPVTTADDQSIKDVLDNQDEPCHIVHVIGICKGAPGRPQIFLGGKGDPFGDPSPLVNLLTSCRTKPQLVVLQLCDFVDGDATENFERLAPDLIRKRIPAVLALQLPARVEQADQVGLGADFYRSLATGMTVGEAVQESRVKLRKQRVDRRFGTPVLYLQQDGPLILERRDPPSVGAVAQTGDQAAEQMKRRLADSIPGQISIEDRIELLEWVNGLDLRGGDPAVARELVQARRRDNPNPALVEVFRRMLEAIRQQEQGGGRGSP